MPIATILENKGAGLYSVTIDRDRDKIDDEISWLNGVTLQLLNQQKGQLNSKITIDNANQLAGIAAQLDDITQQIAEAQANNQPVVELQKQWAEVLAFGNALHEEDERDRRKLNAVNADIDHAQKKLDSLIAEMNKAILPQDVWCADYTIDINPAAQKTAVYLQDDLTDNGYAPIILPQKYSPKGTEATFWDNQIALITAKIDDYLAKIQTLENEVIDAQTLITALLAEKSALVSQIVAAKLAGIAQWQLDAMNAQLKTIDIKINKTVAAAQYNRTKVKMIEVYKAHLEFDKLKYQATKQSMSGANYLTWANKTQIEPTANQNTPTAAINLALLPAHQRWWPTYRAATATAIDEGADTMDVMLWPAFSPPSPLTGQQLEINKVNSLSAVPVVYMNCHAKAFDVGDNVLVDFQGFWETPRVIGFVAHPKQCPFVPGDECIGVRIYNEHEYGYTLIDGTHVDLTYNGTTYSAISRFKWFNQFDVYGNAAGDLVADWALRTAIEGRDSETRELIYQDDFETEYLISVYHFFAGNNTLFGYQTVPQNREGFERVRVHRVTFQYSEYIGGAGQVDISPIGYVPGSLIIDYAVDEIPLSLTATDNGQVFHVSYRGLQEYTPGFFNEFLACCNYLAGRCDLDVRAILDDVGGQCS